MSGLSALVDWANVAAGAAAVAALVYGWRQTTRQSALEKRLRDEAEDQRLRGVAGKFVAWAVVESPEGSVVDLSEGGGGVVVVNGTDEVVLGVDVKTQRAAGSGFDDDGFAGQRFALVPPGVLYLPQVVEESGDHRWAEPIPVDHSQGRFSVSFRDDNDQLQVMNLAPVTRRPEPKRVVLLRFQVADTDWTRDASGGLSPGFGSPTWDDEFVSSEHVVLEPSRLRQHQPSPAGQDLIVKLFERLSDGTVDSVPSAESVVAPDVLAWGVVRIRRTRGNGQGLFLMVRSDAEWPRFYVSSGRKGDNLEAFPNDGLQFHAARDARAERLAVPEFASKSNNTASRWSHDLDALVAVLGRSVRDRLDREGMSS